MNYVPYPPKIIFIIVIPTIYFIFGILFTALTDVDPVSES